ncbi:hypothetical protein EWM64_g104 [Hericium alpestre]|uniref:Uncharacterized protein n=1 Tax=Hericium alpestre TaxID=135208 RepID=A0A4Z0ABX1_9AGAM|nr:hypothetical protein EWM64_g104 [Hericium alpestre]
MSGSSSSKTLKSFRLSQADYNRHVSRYSYAYIRDPLKLDEDPPTLKVSAESEEAKEVLRPSSSVAGQDWISVPYGSKDNIKLIMQRVEKVIRIPIQHWLRCNLYTDACFIPDVLSWQYLAGDGTVFWPRKDLADLDYFMQPQTEPIEVILLPKSDVDDYITANRKAGRWKRFPHEPPVASELPANPYARARALFPLVDTTDSPHWAHYIAHREAAEARVDKAFEKLYCHEHTEYWDMIRDATLKSLFGEDDLAEEECKKIADAVANTDLWTNHDEIEMRDAEVTTRLHSLVSPTSVDVNLIFHHRTRMHSVEYHYTLGFRINTKPVAPLEDPPGRGRLVSLLHTGQGWRTFGWFYVDYQSCEHSACPVSTRDLKQVHDAVFGPDEKGKLGERNGDGHRVNDDARLYLSAEKPGISAAHLRKICGIPPLEEDDTADLSREQMTGPTEPSEDEYGSDDGGYGRGRRDEECIIA